MSPEQITATKVLSLMEHLSVSERISIVENIWDSIASSAKHLRVSDQQKKVLDNRLSEYKKDRVTGSEWSNVKERISSEL